MRHTATIEPGHPRPNRSPASDRGADDARTWLLRRLRWEDHFRELRAKQRNRPHITTSASIDEPSA
jgi:hypothetical protein